MKKLLSCLILVLFFVKVQAQSLQHDFPLEFKISVSNPLNTLRRNVMVVITSEQLKKNIKKFNSKAFVVLDGGKEIPSQYNTKDQYSAGIVFVLDSLSSSESRELVVRYHSIASMQRNYPKKTQAELSHKTGGEWKNREYVGGEFKNVESLDVPPEHKDHSWFIRYEGPGWESDKVGYRFYLDQRNATDVFGKTSPNMMLQQVGLDGFDSYHNLQPWGMDVMKVGKSLGVGSIGAIANDTTIRVEKTDHVACRITENGSVYSSIETNYAGWKIKDKKYDVKSQLSIHAGTRLTHQQLIISGEPENLCTGIVKDKAAKLFTSNGDATAFGYIATYGNQSLHADGLGLVVFFNPNQRIEFSADEFSTIIKLKPLKGKLDYYFAAAWVLEPDGIKDEADFLKYVQQTAEELANPVRVEIQTSTY